MSKNPSDKKRTPGQSEDLDQEKMPKREGEQQEKSEQQQRQTGRPGTTPQGGQQGDEDIDEKTKRSA